jgi:hypothetical protein
MPLVFTLAGAIVALPVGQSRTVEHLDILAGFRRGTIRGLLACIGLYKAGAISTEGAFYVEVKRTRALP